MQLTRRLVLGGAAASAAACVSAPEAPGMMAQARTLALDLQQANRLPALSLAVMRENRLIWAEAFGKADLELDVTARPAHRFRLGSVSKTVTASLAAKLAGAGAVDLDAPIGAYMPELPQHHRATTLRQLLTHRGGVRHYIDRDFTAEAPGPINDRRYATTQDILDVFIHDPLVAPAGAQVSYSTFGYTLISIMLESAAGKSFLDLVAEEIAAPLGLTTLGFDAPGQIQANRVSGYSQSEDVGDGMPEIDGPWANAPVSNPAYKWAGGGMLGTASDLARFGAAHLTAGVFSRAVLDALFTVQVEASERSPPLGLGWRIDHDERGRLRWHHAGSQAGARASLVVYPSEKLSVALAANLTAPDDVLTPSAGLADIFLA